MPAKPAIQLAAPIETKVAPMGKIYDLADLWKIADAGPEPSHTMTLDEMNRAKGLRPES